MSKYCSTMFTGHTREHIESALSEFVAPAEIRNLSNQRLLNAVHYASNVGLDFPNDSRRPENRVFQRWFVRAFLGRARVTDAKAALVAWGMSRDELDRVKPQRALLGLRQDMMDYVYFDLDVLPREKLMEIVWAYLNGFGTSIADMVRTHTVQTRTYALVAVVSKVISADEAVVLTDDQLRDAHLAVLGYTGSAPHRYQVIPPETFADIFRHQFRLPNANGHVALGRLGATLSQSLRNYSESEA